MNHPLTGSIERAAKLHAQEVRARLFGAGGKETLVVKRARPIAAYNGLDKPKRISPPVRCNRPFTSVAIEIIAQETANAGIGKADFYSRSRRMPVTLARQMAAYRIRQHTPLSLKAIAKVIGGMDHTTVLHAIRKISKSVTNQEMAKAGVVELTRLARLGADSETIIIRGYELGVPVKQISRISGRTVMSIVGKAYRLGLKHITALDSVEMRRRVSEGQKARWAAQRATREAAGV